MSGNSLSAVRYYDYDTMRAVLYDLFGWYMENVSLITETAEKMNVSIDELFQDWRRRMVKEMEDLTSAKRGDEIDIIKETDLDLTVDIKKLEKFTKGKPVIIPTPEDYS